MTIDIWCLLTRLGVFLRNMTLRKGQKTTDRRREPHSILERWAQKKLEETSRGWSKWAKKINSFEQPRKAPAPGDNINH